MPAPKAVELDEDPFASKPGKGKPSKSKSSAPSSKRSGRAPAPAIALAGEDDLVAPTGRVKPPGAEKSPDRRKDRKAPAAKVDPPAKPAKKTPEAKEQKKPEPSKIVLPTQRRVDQCAVCREPALEEEVCAECGISLHPACLKSAKRCPSADCAGSKSFHEQLTIVMKRPRTLLITAVCVVVIAGVAVGGVLMLNRHRDLQETEAFLQVAPTLAARQALFRGEKLRPSVQERPQVSKLLTELRERVSGEEARKRATQALEQALPGSDREQVQAAVAAALKADSTCALAYVRRAELKYRQALAEWPPDTPVVLKTLVKPALVDLNEAIRHEPTSATGYYGRAMLYVLLGKTRAAQSDLQRVLRYESDSDSALRAMALGRQAELAKDPLEALSQFDRALISDQRKAEALLAKGWILLGLGKASQSYQLAQKARVLDPREVAAYLLSIEAARLTGERTREQILADLERALRLFPACARALALRAAYGLQHDPSGRVSSGKADRELARRDAKRALLQDAAQVLAQGVLADLEAFRGKATEAERMATRALEAGDPRDQLAVRILRARLRIARRDTTDRVFHDLDAVLAFDPDHVTALLLRGHAHLLRGRRDQARHDLDRAIFLSPDLTEAYRLRGITLLERDPPAVAAAILDFTHYIRANTRRPGVGRVFRLRGRANHLATRYDDALKDLRQAKRLGAEVPSVLLDRVTGDAAYRARRWTAAKTAYESLLRRKELGRKERAEVTRRLRDVDGVLRGKFRTF